jgi:DNA-binding PadR family transcriptional regulator
MEMDRELLLLGLLRQVNMHGYQLMEFIERDLSTCTDLKKPTAYALLDKMAQQGWISEQEVREGKRPPRRVYSITPTGEAQFQQLLRANLRAYEPAKFAEDIGLAFADALDPAEVRALLDERRAILLGELEAARAVPEHHGTLQFVVQHRLAHLECELQWLDQVRARLAESDEARPINHHSGGIS